jgi:tagatose 6-phosphate kinase
VRLNEEEAKILRRIETLAETVVVSMGERGARFVHRGRWGRIRVPRLQAVNPVGAGDCMAGGIATAIDAGRGLAEALALGAACGAASVLTPETARVRRKDVTAIVKEVSVEWGS